MSAVKFGLDFLDTKTRSSEGQWLKILHPSTGKPTGIELFLYGPDSKEFLEAEKKIKQRHARAIQQNGDGATDQVFEEEDEIRRELLTAITGDWKKVLDPDGRHLNFKPERVSALYETYPVIQRQASDFINDIANWLLATEKNSQSGQSGDSASAGEVPTAETLSHL